MLPKALRHVGLLRLPRVDVVAAASAAEQACKARGIPWDAPVLVQQRWRVWRFFTASDRRGGNATVWVSMQDGSVTRVIFHSR